MNNDLAVTIAVTLATRTVTAPLAWDRRYVEACMKAAAAVITALPMDRDGKPGGFKSSMPGYVRDVSEAYGYGRTKVQPTPRQIDLAETAMAWCLLIPHGDDRRVVVARLFGARWTAIAARDGRSRVWLQSGVYRRAFDLIAEVLEKKNELRTIHFTHLTDSAMVLR